MNFAPGAVFVKTQEGCRPAAGPIPVLREGLVLALAAEVAGEKGDRPSLRELAKALLACDLVPSLGSLRMGFPSGGVERTRRQLVAGAFVGFCLEKYGAARYRDLHFSDFAAQKTPLGELSELEKNFRQWLVDARPGADRLRNAERTLGLDVLRDASRWRDLTAASRSMKFKPEGAGKFTADEDGIEWNAPPGASGEASSGRLVVPDPAPARGAFRVTLRFDEGSRARLTLRTHDGKTTSALLSRSGLSLVTPDNTIAVRSEFALEPRRWYDCTLVLEGGAGRVYLDGILVGEATRGLGVGPGNWEIEAGGRRVEVRSVAIRSL